MSTAQVHLPVLKGSWSVIIIIIIIIIIINISIKIYNFDSKYNELMFAKTASVV
jgi:hypothetical protein